MPPQTHYTQSGEVNIAYQVVGDGPLDLVFVPGFISHLDLQWADPRIARFLEKLASFSRLIMFDKRGTGLSDPVAGPASLEDRMDDVRAVMDAAGSERAALFGLSEGGPMSVMFAATYPERTRALVLCGTFPTGVDDVEDNPSGQRWVDVIHTARAAAQHWGRNRGASQRPSRGGRAREASLLHLRPARPGAVVATASRSRRAGSSPTTHARSRANLASRWSS